MKLKVISFNIKCCDDPDGNSVAERAPRLGTIIDSYDPDVMGLQEYRPIWEPRIEELFLDRYDIFNKYRSETTNDRESSPILWKKDKFEMVSSGYFWLSDTPEVESRGWDKRFNCFRMCVYVVLKSKADGRLMTVMNTHFGFGADGQEKSAGLIQDYSRKISSHPTFIVGDFNMVPGSRGYLAMTSAFTDVNAATVNDLRPTFHKYDPAPHKKHIDYCFAGEGVTPVTQKIIEDTVDGKYPSDHFGLYIELDL